MNEFLFPSVVENLNGKDQSADLVSLHLIRNRAVYLTGEITDILALSVITQLRYLGEKSEEDDITLYINSPGGSVTAGLAIRDVMDSLPCDVATVVEGSAASMAAVLAACGAKGKRYAAPSAEIMIHQPMGGVKGQATDITTAAEHIQYVKHRLASTLAEQCGKKSEVLLQDMERDCWMTSEEAREYGLVDHIGFPDAI